MKTRNEQIQEFYHTYPYPFAGNYRGFFQRHIFPHVRALNPTSILDAGCGTGNITADIARLFPNAKVIGVDFAANAIAIANERFSHIPNLTFRCSDLLHPLDLEAPVDLIYCQGVLHHIDAPEQVLRLWQTYLHPAGCAVIWLYNPYGRRFISDVISLERALLGPQHEIATRLQAVRACERWLTHTSWSRWAEQHLAAMQREGLGSFLRARLKDMRARRRERAARQLADERKLIDRYLNPSARYYSVDDAEQLFRTSGFILTDIVEFTAIKWPRIVEQSPWRRQLDDRATQWRVLEILQQPRGLTYLLHPGAPVSKEETQEVKI